MNDAIGTMLYMLGLVAAIVIFAFLEQPYGLVAASALLVAKHLGRITTVLRNKGDER